MQLKFQLEKLKGNVQEREREREKKVHSFHFKLILSVQMSHCRKSTVSYKHSS